MAHGITPRLRAVLGMVLDRQINADESVERVVDDLDAYVADRDRARQQASGTNQWQFGTVPELVVQVPTGDGFMMVMRLAGGTARATGSGAEDKTARAIARAMLQLAQDYLDETEPTRATAARSDR